MRLDQVFCKLPPLRLYSIDMLLDSIKPDLGSKKREAFFSRRLSRIVSQNHFPPQGDGMVDGKRAWYGFRFAATLHTGQLPNLPVSDRPVWLMDIGPFLDRFLRAKLELIPNQQIQPEDIHPFIVGLMCWKPLHDFKGKSRKRLNSTLSLREKAKIRP